MATSASDPCELVTETTASVASGSQTTSETTSEGNTSQATTTETAATSDTATTAMLTDLRLTELLPNPTGEDTVGEFIELQNVGAAAADLVGWKFVSASNKSFNLPSVSLAAGAYQSFPYSETHLVLINSNGTYSLVAPDGTVIDSVTYGTAADGKSYARSASNTWQWNTKPTPGAENDESGFASATSGTSSSSSGTSSSTSSANTNTSTVAATVTTTATTSTAATEASVSPTPFTAADIAIVAFLPRPASGGSEWIELYNSGDVPAALTGWLLDDIDGGSKPFSLNVVTLTPGERRRFSQTETKIGLNDDGDDVRLLAADGSVVSVTSYVKALIGQARLKVDGIWLWESEVTVASNTAVNETSTVTAGSAATTTTTPSSSSSGSDALSSLNQEETVTLSAPLSGTQILTATVTLPPNKIGTHTFAVETDDGIGMFIRAYGNPMPSLVLGSRLTMTVKVTVTDEIVSATARTKDMKVIGKGTLGDPDDVEDISPIDNGRLVLLRGTVTAGGKRWLTVSPSGLDDGITVTMVGGEVPAGNHEGMEAEISGVVRIRGEKIEVLAEGEELKLTAAPVIQEMPEISDVTATEPLTPAPPKRGPSIPAVATPIGGVAASAYALWRKRRGVINIPS